ncbi:protein phosphatase 2C domain-containing protein [Streptomyces sp. NBC_01478]|uniref:protein phosphatase 2C domain-containing protein n=1 Tax=Streptomyces sp. NBC_01478 TaxID=2903882 RepID=UPI002E30500C|nr:protein phosphatase 2C domain-containing protein [Streptomyces sp. NBC_01478]
MSQQGGTPTGHEDDWWSQLYDDTPGDTGPTAAGDSVDDRFVSAAGTVGGGAGEPRSLDAGSLDAGERVPSAREGRPSADGGPASPGGAEPSVDEGTPPLFTPLTPAAAPGEQAPPDPTWQDLPSDPPSELPPAAPQRQAGAEFPPAYPPPPTVPAPPADRPTAAPEDRRPDGLSAPQSPAAPARPADSPAVAAEGRSPEDLPSPPAYPQSSAVPAPPADKPAIAPRELRPEDPSGPGRYPQPSAAPTPPTAAPRPDRPFDPRPYPQPPTTPAPVADTPIPTPRNLPRPYPQRQPPPVTPQPLPIAPPPDLPALAPPPPPPASLALDYVGSGPPTYDAEPTALPLADPDDLDDLVADTVLDGARYGTSTIRAASVRGDSARFRGEPRRDSLLTARFGTGEQALVLVAMATGARATPGAHRAAAEACHWIGRAVGRSHARLAEDIRAARRGDLKSGLHRLTDRSLGKLRASAAEQGIDPEEYSAGLRCLLLPAHPECRTRVFFGVGPGGLFRLRDGEWQDIEPAVGDLSGEAVVGFGSQPAETPEGDRLTMDLGIPTPPSPYEPAPEPPREPFRFRASVARPGDTLLMCTGGLAEPLRGEPALSAHLAGRWSGTTPPGLAAFLADTQVRVKGYADDRTAAAVWEA